MKKRRIDITRERWTRIRVESRGPGLCPSCRGAPDLASPSVASEQSGVSLGHVNSAIRSGLLPRWETEGGEALVCLGCLGKLREERTI